MSPPRFCCVSHASHALRCGKRTASNARIPHVVCSFRLENSQGGTCTLGPAFVNVSSTAYAAILFSTSLSFEVESSASMLRTLSLAHTASGGAQFDLRASLYATTKALPTNNPSGFPLTEVDFTVSRTSDGFSTTNLLSLLDLYSLVAGRTYALVLRSNNPSRAFLWRYCANGQPPFGQYGVTFVSLKYSQDEGQTW